MKILSKRTGMVYDNIILENKDGYIFDTQNMNEINFNEYVFGYTYLCDDCAKIANKSTSIEGSHCFNNTCKSNSFIGEVTFTKEEIMNDLVVYKQPPH